MDPATTNVEAESERIAERAASRSALALDQALPPLSRHKLWKPLGLGLRTAPYRSLAFSGLLGCSMASASASPWMCWGSGGG